MAVLRHSVIIFILSFLVIQNKLTTACICLNSSYKEKIIIADMVLKIQAKESQDYNHLYYNRLYNFTLLKIYKVSQRSLPYLNQNYLITPDSDCGMTMGYNETLIISGIIQDNVLTTDVCFFFVNGKQNIIDYDARH